MPLNDTIPRPVFLNMSIVFTTANAARHLCSLLRSVYYTTFSQALGHLAETNKNHQCHAYVQCNVDVYNICSTIEGVYCDVQKALRMACVLGY